MENCPYERSRTKMCMWKFVCTYISGCMSVCRTLVRTEENVEHACKTLVNSPWHSGREHATSLRIKFLHLGGELWKTIWTYAHTKFKLHNNRKVKIINSVSIFVKKYWQWLCWTSSMLFHIWLSDEAHFDLFGNVNKQICRYYADSQPCQTISKLLHSSWVTVWCAISSPLIIVPVSFENEGSNVTVNSQRYLGMLKIFYIPELGRRRVHIKSTYFQ